MENTSETKDLRICIVGKPCPSHTDCNFSILLRLGWGFLVADQIRMLVFIFSS